jgi:hypothetical protein
MKKILNSFLILASAILFFVGCKKDPGNNGGGSDNGQAMFWVASDFGCGNIAVTIDGITKYITNFNSGGAPTCGTAGTATFNLSPGIYSYSASCTGLIWNGTVTVTSNNCSKIEFASGGGGGGGGTGQAMFWIASDFSCGNITVNCNGQTQTISAFYSGGEPACGASGTATFTMSPGTYSFSAACTGKTWNGTITITAGGCSKMQLTSSGGGGGSTGQAMFWIASDLSCGNITVNCNGQSRTISSFYSSGAPSCGASGTATFSMAPGTYSYTASCTGKTWNGTITITAGGCSKMQLTSSGGGGGSTGQAMFWIASDLSCGNITVNCNGQSRTISSFYSSGAPSCGASGTATFSMAPGTYSYTASCTGKTWNGTITVTAGGCSKLQLTSSGGEWRRYRPSNLLDRIRFWLWQYHS